MHCLFCAICLPKCLYGLLSLFNSNYIFLFFVSSFIPILRKQYMVQDRYTQGPLQPEPMSCYGHPSLDTVLFANILRSASLPMHGQALSFYSPAL